MNNNVNSPRVLVLILSYNGKKLLDDAVSSYLENDYENFKVVVIDNGSTDGTKEYVEDKWPNVMLLRTDKNLKYSGGFNLGLEYAFNKNEADFVLITNNDVVADKSVISELVKVANTDDKCAFATGKVYYHSHPEIIQTAGRYHDPLRWVGKNIGGKEKDTGQYDEIKELQWCDDIFWLVKKEVYFETGGGYDTEFKFQCEDLDWQIRAKKKGFKILFAPKAKIWHKESMTIGKSSPNQIFYTVRNSLVVRIKHGSISFVLRYLFKYYLKNRYFKPLLQYIIRLDFKRFWAVFTAGISGFFYAFLKLFRK